MSECHSTGEVTFWQTIVLAVCRVHEIAITKVKAQRPKESPSDSFMEEYGSPRRMQEAAEASRRPMPLPFIQ